MPIRCGHRSVEKFLSFRLFGGSSIHCFLNRLGWFFEHDCHLSLVSVCRTHNVPLYINENWRWQYPIRQLKKALDAGRIGNVFRATIDYRNSFPVFDTFRNNAYVIADSNHGYKMIGVGALVAKELVDEPQELLEPFRFSRYEAGDLHPTSNSPFPWS